MIPLPVVYSFRVSGPDAVTDFHNKMMLSKKPYQFIKSHHPAKLPDIDVTFETTLPKEELLGLLEGMKQSQSIRNTLVALPPVEKPMNRQSYQAH